MGAAHDPIGIEVDDDAADFAAGGRGCGHGLEVRNPIKQRGPRREGRGRDASRQPLPNRAGQRSLRVLLTGAVADHPPAVLTYPRSHAAAADPGLR